MTPTLVVIRGNSGSGKTTAAREVRCRYGRGAALIEQDHWRRVVLREHGGLGDDAVAPGFIDVSVRHLLGAGYHVIVEGILHTRGYRSMLRRLITDHPGPSHVFYLDVSFAETVRRHHSRAEPIPITADDMAGWYTELDVLNVGGEVVIGEESTLEQTVATILEVSGLTVAAPLTPCPARCPRCADKASAAAPERAPAEPTTPALTAASITVAALAIVPAGDGRLVFIRQQRGPYAGSMLLPGGKVEPGEAFEDAARREALEEAGVRIGALRPCGVYDMAGRTAAGVGYRFLMFAFLAGPDAVRIADGGHHVDEVVLAEPDRVRPHPTVMRILTDAGAATYDPGDVERELRDAGIAMRSYPIGATGC